MEKKKNYIVYIFVILLLAIILGVVLYVVFKRDNTSNSQNGQSTTLIDVEVDYNDDELKQDYSDYSAEVNLSKLSSSGTGVSISDNTITITADGVYHFTGTNSDANIVVNAPDSALVVIVLDNVDLTSETTACITGVEADNIIINLKDGTENILTDSSKYTVFIEDDEPDGTIFSKTDLCINGTGKLTVNANYQDGIVSKDDLKILNAEIIVNAADDGIRGKDSLSIQDAKIIVIAEQDGLKSTNEEEGKGYVYIDGGTYEISVGDDGIHGENSLFIVDGTINITKSYEGLEAQYIQIDGGDITVVASDDGINVNGGNDTMMMGNPNQYQTQNTEENSTRVLVINGGNIYVNASGDGLDSNGSILMTGGTVEVSGPTNAGNGPLDFDSSFEMTGGTILYYGSSSMWQNPSSNSTTNTIVFAVSSGKTGDEIVLKDSSENVVFETTAEKSYQQVGYSSSDITVGETYTLYVNGKEISSQEQTSQTTSNGSSEGGMMGPGGNQMSGRRGF